MPFKKSFKPIKESSAVSEEKTQPKGRESLSDRALNLEGSAMAKGFLKEKESAIVSSINSYGGQRIFKIGMTEKELRIKLFLLEEEPGFSTLLDREKYNIIARRSDNRIQEWYYDLVTFAELPEEYKMFKELMINKCTEKGIITVTAHTPPPLPY